MDIIKTQELDLRELGLLYGSLSNYNNFLEQSIYEFDNKYSNKEIKKVWNKLLVNVEILRSIFIYKGVDKPIRGIVDNIKIKIPFVKLGDMETLLNYADQILNDKIKYTVPPLMKVNLVECCDKKYMIWTFNHLLLDGWSCQLIIRKIYNELNGIRDIEIENYSKGVQVSDNRIEEKMFEGVQPVPNNEQFEYSRVEKKINNAKYNRLNEKLKKRGISKFEFIKLLWGLVKCKENESETVCFGILDSGRMESGKEINNRIGCFIKVIPFVVTLRGSDNVWDIVERIQKEKSIHEGSKSLSEILYKRNLSPNDVGIDSIIVYQNYLENKSKFRVIRQIGSQTMFKSTLIILPNNQLRLILKGRMGKSIGRDQLNTIDEIITKILINDDLKVGEIRNKINKKTIKRNIVKKSDLIQILKDVIGIQELDKKKTIYQLGGHSIAAIEIVKRIYDLYGVKLYPYEIIEAKNIYQIEKILHENKKI